MIEINLTGKTAIVTGASQGLGAATVAMLHRAGANVVVNYFDDEAGVNRAKANAVVAHLEDRALAVPGDVCSLSAMQQVFSEAAAQFGGAGERFSLVGLERECVGWARWVD